MLSHALRSDFEKKLYDQLGRKDVIEVLPFIQTKI